jgi:beta-lactamase superfamily II metal-dependent hydrolase
MAAKIHLLNTAPGDCTIIQHVSGRVSMIDICDGNDYVAPNSHPAYSTVAEGKTSGFLMCQSTTNPIAYAQNLGIKRVWRFILTHPDMDHLDGFHVLLDSIGLDNYWDSEARRPKPGFENSPFREEDWDRYETVIAGKEPGVCLLKKLAGAAFPFANKNDDGRAGGDGLHILAPDIDLLNDKDLDDDVNEGSYVILYRSVGGRILLPGDAHDAAWEYVLKTSAADVRKCSFMLAPHHGRDSGRSYDFLDTVQPKLTLIGCAPSEYIDYSQWRNRGLDYITSNQCGNVVLEANDNKIVVWVQNIDFAVSRGFTMGLRNDQGYAFCGIIDAE